MNEEKRARIYAAYIAMKMIFLTKLAGRIQMVILLCQIQGSCDVYRGLNRNLYDHALSCLCVIYKTCFYKYVKWNTWNYSICERYARIFSKYIKVLNCGENEIVTEI